MALFAIAQHFWSLNVLFCMLRFCLWWPNTHVHIWPKLHDKLHLTAEMDELWKLYLGITHRITRCYAAIWTHQNTYTIVKTDI